MELQELTAAKYFSIAPTDWDALPVEERTRLIAAFQDAEDLKHIALLPEDERRQLIGSIEWVQVEM